MSVLCVRFNEAEQLAILEAAALALAEGDIVEHLSSYMDEDDNELLALQGKIATVLEEESPYGDSRYTEGAPGDPDDFEGAF